MSNLINIVHAKADNTNDFNGQSSIIYNGPPSTTLTITKTADISAVVIGDTFTYTIVVTNPGTINALNVTIKDIAPEHINFILSEITATQGSIDTTKSTTTYLVFNAGTISANNGTVTITVPANVVA